MEGSNNGLWTVLAIASGFALSFLGFGVFWIGTPWALQCLMFLPFCLAAVALSRFGVEALLMLVGAAPISLLMLQVRDKDGSHLMSYLVVGAWLSGVVAGHFLGRRKKPA